MYIISHLILILIAIAASIINCDNTVELTCVSEDDCKTFADLEISAQCLGYCVCFFKKNGTEVTCSPKILKKSNNISNCPCQVVNTECKNEKCVCKNGFMKSENKSSCIAKSVQIGKSCEINEQCIRFDKNSACTSNICKCKENFTEIDVNECRSLAKKETGCDVNNGCGQNQECIQKSCFCNKNYIFESNKTECIAYATYNEFCADQIHCELGIGYGAICENNKCICDGNHTHTIINGRSVCQHQVNYKQKCQKDSDCAKFFDDPSMICEENKCICSDDYQFDGESACVSFDNKSSTSNTFIASFINIIITLLFCFCFV